MKKSVVVLTLVLALLSLVNSWTAQAALPCKSDILEACYASCRDMFNTDLLRTACYGGCLIGCCTSGQT